MRLILLLLTTYFFSAPLTAEHQFPKQQDHRCGQDAITKEIEANASPAELKKWREATRAYKSGNVTNHKSSVAINIPVKAYIVRKTNGKGGLTENDVVQGLHLVNQTFSNSPFNFYYSDIEYINSDTYYVLSDKDEGTDLYLSNNDQNALNVYFVSYLDTGYSGYANFPWFDTNNNFMVVANYAAKTNTYPHEIGHYLGLLHAHETSNGNELVNGSNCSSAGDLLCDTKASPVLAYSNVDGVTCQYNGTETDTNGQNYNPDTDNCMAYGPWECDRVFTTEQIARMEYYYNNDRAAQLGAFPPYTLLNSCSPDDDTDSDGVCNSDDTCSGLLGTDSDTNGTADACEDCPVINFSWEAIMVDYTITPQTKIAFDFKSTVQGEIHEIILDDALDLTPLHRFIFYGTQDMSGTPNTSFDYAYTGEGAYQYFVIPLGDYYTGFAKYLVLTCDEDADAVPANSGHKPANSYFRNVRIFEDTDGDNLCDPTCVVGNTCNDGDDCTTGETYDANCNCIGGTVQDADGDGICNAQDDCSNDPTNSCNQTYCNAQGENTNYEFIQSVELNSQTNNSGDNGGYGDYTSTTLATLGSTNSITLTPGFVNSAYTENWGVWIDFNKDGDFNDTGEEVLSGASSGITPLAGTFAAPTGTGTTTMRVAMRYGQAPSSCETFQSGEVEDYKVELTNEAACSPGSICDDGDACTTNDIYNVDCECTGTFADVDSDTVCDTQDVCPNLNDTLIGTTCDDGNICTINDVYTTDCECVGTFADADSDTVCDAQDACPDFNDTLIGTTCDDGNACTTNDIYTTNCECAGTLTDADGDGICDAEDACPNDPNNACIPPEYCEAQATNTNYEFIQSVELNGQKNDSGDNSGYADFTNTTLATLNSTNTITLTPGFKGSAYNENWAVWIDFNKDGDFDDTGEEVLSGASSGTTPLTGTFAAPAGTGSTTMRVAMDYSKAPLSCGTIQYGEVEDYLVDVNIVVGKLTISNQLIQVYPNPANGFVNVNLQEIIHTGSIESITATIYTMDGKQAYSEEIEAASIITINTYHLPEASYILRLSADDGRTFTGRFVKL